MKKAQELLDSKKFTQLLDQLVTATQEEDEVAQVVALDAILEAAEDGKKSSTLSPEYVVQLKATYPANIMPAVDGAVAEMTPEETAEVSKIADAMAAATVPRETLVAEVIKEVVLPAFKKGYRCFLIPLSYKGRRVSISGNVWVPMMRQAGISFNELFWVYDQRTWQGEAPTLGLNQPLTLQ